MLGLLDKCCMQRDRLSWNKEQFPDKDTRKILGNHRAEQVRETVYGKRRLGKGKPAGKSFSRLEETLISIPGTVGMRKVEKLCREYPIILRSILRTSWRSRRRRIENYRRFCSRVSRNIEICH